MVSFQCDGCSDVVTKPKLDKHRQACHASFTCIDCSVTFNGRAEYKNHTQCMTEAEKYQGHMYKAQKSNNHNPRNNRQQPQTQNDHSNATPTGKDYPPDAHYNNAPRGGWCSWGRVQPRWEATGANGTPLGTPIRMSPVTFVELETPSTVPIKEDAPVKAEEEGAKKRKVEHPVKANGEPPKKKSKASHAATGSQSAPAPVAETREKKKKEKKLGEGFSAESSKVVEKKDKKSKRSKEVAHEKPETPIVTTETKQNMKGGELSADIEKSKKRKRELVMKAATTSDGATGLEVNTKKKSKTLKKDAAGEVTGNGVSDKLERKEKKHKKSKSKDGTSL